MSSEPIPKRPTPDLFDDADHRHPHSPLRLSIAHLLLWTLGIAVALALYRPFLAAQPSSQEFVRRYETFRHIVVLTMLPFSGAGIAALLLALIQRMRRQSQFPSAPGHWLLMTRGVDYLPTAVVIVVSSARRDSRGPESIFLALSSVYVLAAAYRDFPLLRSRDSPRWTWFFVIDLTMQIVSVVTMCLPAIAYSDLRNSGPNFTLLKMIDLLSYVGLAHVVVVIAVLGREIFLRPHRDYLHWAGCVALAMSSAEYVVYRLMPYLLR